MRSTVVDPRAPKTGRSSQWRPIVALPTHKSLWFNTTTVPPERVDPTGKGSLPNAPLYRGVWSWEEFCKMEPSSVTPAPPSPARRTEHWGRDLNPNQEESPHQGYKQTTIHHRFPPTKAASLQWWPQGCHFQGRGTTPSPCPTCLSKANPRTAAASFSLGWSIFKRMNSDHTQYPRAAFHTVGTTALTFHLAGNTTHNAATQGSSLHPCPPGVSARHGTNAARAQLPHLRQSPRLCVIKGEKWALSGCNTLDQFSTYNLGLN